MEAKYPIQLKTLNVILGLSEKGPISLSFKSSDNTVIQMYPGRMEVVSNVLDRVSGVKSVTVTEFFAGANPAWEYSIA